MPPNMAHTHCAIILPAIKATFVSRAKKKCVTRVFCHIISMFFPFFFLNYYNILHVSENSESLKPHPMVELLDRFVCALFSVNSAGLCGDKWSVSKDVL